MSVPKKFFTFYLSFIFLLWAAMTVSAALTLDLKVEQNAKLSADSQQEIYTLSVSLAGQTAPRTYHVAYDLDGVYRKEFQNQTVPFLFNDNFSGLAPGDHTVKVDLDDANNRVVATQTVHILLP